VQVTSEKNNAPEPVRGLRKSYAAPAAVPTDITRDRGEVGEEEDRQDPGQVRQRVIECLHVDAHRDPGREFEVV